MQIYIFIPNMRSICEVLIFQSPFESVSEFDSKFEKIQTMFQDYLINASMPLPQCSSESPDYYHFTFGSEKESIMVVFSSLKYHAHEKYFPRFIVSYHLETSLFDVENIKLFLNDNLQFLFNVFGDAFFVDTDRTYTIQDHNQGKKINFKDLESFDTSNPYSLKNKLLLDCLCYRYYICMKSHASLSANAPYLASLELSTPSGIPFLIQGEYKQEVLEEL